MAGIRFLLHYHTTHLYDSLGHVTDDHEELVEQVKLLIFTIDRNDVHETWQKIRLTAFWEYIRNSVQILPPSWQDRWEEQKNKRCRYIVSDELVLSVSCYHN